MRPDQCNLLRCADARRIYNMISEQGPVSSIDIGRELSDIPMERRRGLMQKLHHVGLVERSSDTYHHSIWRVTE